MTAESAHLREITASSAPYFLWRLLIDEHHEGRDFGRPP